MLIVGNVHVHHGHLHVLKEVDLQVREGEIVAVVGANGAGKSTLLGTIAGIYAPKEGKFSLKMNRSRMERWNKSSKEEFALFQRDGKFLMACLSRIIYFLGPIVAIAAIFMK